MQATIESSKRKRRKLPNNKRIRDFLRECVGGTGDGESLEALRQLLRERCKKDLWFFGYHVLEFHDLDDELHKDMAMRWMFRNKASFSLWQVPRGHLKTSLWTQAGTLWELINNPHERHVIVSAKLEIAQAILADIRSFVETREIFRWLFPEYCPDLAGKEKQRRCKWGQDRLDFPCSRWAGRREGNIQVMGVEASLVSQHFDKFTFDDPVNDLNTSTKAYRDKVDRWYRDALQLRHSPAESKVRIIGTSWHYDDMYARRRRAELKRRKRLRAEGKPVKPHLWIYIRRVVEPVESGGFDIVGHKNVAPIWPQRFDKQTIEDIREDNGSYIFNCQYMNNPISAEDAIFKREDIKACDYFDIPEQVANFAAVDMAVGETDDSDYSVITVASFDSEGKMYTRQICRGKYSGNQLVELLNGICRKWNVKKVGIETTCFQKVVYKNYKTFAEKMGWKIPWVEMKRGNTAKLKRFLSLQPRVERGDFLYEEGIAHSDQMLDEMTTLSLTHKPAFDDILDTLADLEQLFYKAHEIVEVEQDPTTFDAHFGSILDLNEEDYTPKGRRFGFGIAA